MIAKKAMTSLVKNYKKSTKTNGLVSAASTMGSMINLQLVMIRLGVLVRMCDMEDTMKKKGIRVTPEFFQKAHNTCLARHTKFDKISEEDTIEWWGYYIQAIEFMSDEESIEYARSMVNPPCECECEDY